MFIGKKYGKDLKRSFELSGFWQRRSLIKIELLVEFGDGIKILLRVSQQSDEQRSPPNHDVMMMRGMRRIMMIRMMTTIITLIMMMQVSTWWSDHWEDDGQMHQDHGRQQRTQLQWSGISSMPSRSSDCTFSQCLVKHCIVFSHNISYPFPRAAVNVWLLCTFSDIVIFEEPEERTRGWWDVLSRRVAPSQAPGRISVFPLLPGFCNLD